MKVAELRQVGRTRSRWRAAARPHLVPGLHEEEHADVACRVRLQGLPDGDEVLEGLGHLAPLDVEVPRVQEVAHPLPRQGRTPQGHAQQKGVRQQG